MYWCLPLLTKYIAVSFCPGKFFALICSKQYSPWKQNTQCTTINLLQQNREQSDLAVCWSLSPPAKYITVGFHPGNLFALTFSKHYGLWKHIRQLTTIELLQWNRERFGTLPTANPQTLFSAASYRCNAEIRRICFLYCASSLQKIQIVRASKKMLVASQLKISFLSTAGRSAAKRFVLLPGQHYAVSFHHGAHTALGNLNPAQYTARALSTSTKTSINLHHAPWLVERPTKKAFCRSQSERHQALGALHEMLSFFANCLKTQFF